MRYLIVILLAGCSVQAGNYDCNESDHDKMSAFVLDCYKSDANNMTTCLSAAKKVYCKNKD